MPGSELQQARAQWRSGDWKELSKISLNDIEKLGDRADIALLCAAAHLQLSNDDKARDILNQALRWGVDGRTAAKVLIAGVHNTLGRAAALRRFDGQMKSHFLEATQAAGLSMDATAGKTRALAELMDLGLLNEAAGLIDDELKSLQDIQNRRNFGARIEILKTELETLQHELSIAQRRRQVPVAPTSVAAQKPAAGARGDDLQSRSVSQLGQDLWVLERSGYKEGGFFVEFGATDGVLLSNTYLLESEFNWSGVLSEPNPAFLQKLKRNRACKVSTDCIGARSGDQVEFVFADVYGGMLEHLDHDYHGDKRRPYIEAGDHVVTLTTVSLDEFLTRNEAPRVIDYISVDTEGSEADIIEAFPFDKWDVRLWTIEHNFMPQRERVLRVMTENGYQRVEAEWDDWYFKP